MPNIVWTNSDEEMRKELGFTKESGEGRFMHGQRRINGRLFEAVMTILDCIPTADLDDRAQAALKKSRDSVAKIPGEDPPKCENPSS